MSSGGRHVIDGIQVFSFTIWDKTGAKITGGHTQGNEEVEFTKKSFGNYKRV